MHTPELYTAGKPVDSIAVQISYRIIQLFSEGLYSSPHKAIEELVSNAFDAGARKVHVVLGSDLSASDSSIAVIDDGTGMDADGLRQHWLIGVSNKRDNERKNPKRRLQIGKFGIGKLATYVLARRLTHISKSNGHYYSTSIDYEDIPSGDHGGIYTEKQVKLPLRKLAQEQARMVVEPWTNGTKPGHAALKLFGPSAPRSWTVVVMSELKEMAVHIKRGRLRYVLSTAMPLRDDFKLFLDGDEVLPSKLSAQRVKKWIIGKDIKELPEPAPNADDLEATEENAVPLASPHRHGLVHRNGLGRVTGYVEAFKDLLTGGKSDSATDRSHGFFVYARGRLINIDDEYFGIDRNLLRHGTFARFRAVVHIDNLDDELRSSREAVRESVVLNHARNFLRGIFNLVRTTLDKHDEGEDQGAKAARRVAESPASLTRMPILGMIKSAMEGRCSPRYTSYPHNIKGEEKQAFLDQIEAQAKDSEGFIKDVQLVELSQDTGIAVLDISTGILQINSLHPFVAYFLDEYEDKRRSLPLKLLATSEVLMEAQLYGMGFDDDVVRDTMAKRDQLLRYLSTDSTRRSARLIAQALMDSATNETDLEKELVASFNSMGYKAVPLGGSDKPDGMAEANLPAKDGKPQKYAISLEAKSKEKEGKTVSNANVRISTIARHRNEYGCDHALVVGPNFSTSKGYGAALVREIDADRQSTGKTITLCRINDLARLVRLQPLKRLNHARLREFLQQCVTPDECAKWIDKVAEEKREGSKFRELLITIAEEQADQPGASVEYASVVTGLWRGRFKIKMDKGQVTDMCRALARLAPEYVTALETSVELNQSPDKVLEAIGAAIRDYPEDEQ